MMIITGKGTDTEEGLKRLMMIKTAKIMTTI
jgi:hypothetical protein